MTSTEKWFCLGRLAVELHPVVDGNIVLALFLEDEVRVHIAQLFRDAEGQVHSLPGAHRTKGLLEIGVEAVEQTRQMGSFLSQKKPRFRNGSGAEIICAKPFRQCFALPPPLVGEALADVSLRKEKLYF